MDDLGWNYSSFFNVSLPLDANVTLTLVYHSESSSLCMIGLSGVGYNLVGPFMQPPMNKTYEFSFATTTPGVFILSCTNPDCVNPNMDMEVNVVGGESG